MKCPACGTATSDGKRCASCQQDYQRTPSAGESKDVAVSDSIDEVNKRRAIGNKLVNPPFRYQEALEKYGLKSAGEHLGQQFG